MRDRIKVAADANNRSMNAEIVATLQEKYPAPITGDRQAASDREFTVRMIDRLLSQLRANMITQLDGGDPDLQLVSLVRDFLPGKTGE